MIGLLDTAERNQLVLELADYTGGLPRNMSVFLPREHVTRIELHPVPLEYAFKVVRYCEMTAWVEKPPLIIRLLEKYSHLAVFKNAAERLKQLQPLKFHVNDRVWDTFLLALDLPFLDRVVTRDAIERFSNPLEETIRKAGVRVLLVRGAEKTGKSFTLEYIRYVNSVFAQFNFNTIWVDFKKYPTGRFGPRELIVSLLDQVNPEWRNNINLPELDVQQVPRWIQQLLTVLLTQINVWKETENNSGKTMIILDGFDDPNVPRDTLDLIQLMSAAATGQLFIAENDDSIRLVVLGFPENVPNFRNRVRVENLSDITNEDIRLYFKAYAEFCNRSPDEEVLTALVDKVNLPAIPGTPERMKIISQKVLAIAQTVFDSNAVLPQQLSN